MAKQDALHGRDKIQLVMKLLELVINDFLKKLNEFVKELKHPLSTSTSLLAAIQELQPEDTMKAKDVCWASLRSEVSL